MDHSIADLYFKGYIDREDAIARSTNPGKMSKLFEEKQPHPAEKSKKAILTEIRGR
jgi:hypothetical protein